MKKVLMVAVALCMFGSSSVLKAERKDILVKTYPDVLVNATNNYQVNGTGDIVMYAISKDDLGIIKYIYFTYKRKSGTGEVKGQIGPGSKPTDNFIPVNSVSFEIVGLERNIALCLFTNNVGERIYMVFRLLNPNATPTPNRTNPTYHGALQNEICSITNTQVLSYLHNPEVVKVITSRARVANIGVLTTSTDHTLSIGDRITVLGIPDDSYNLTGVEVLSVPTTTTFTYSCPGNDEASVASTGIVFRPEVYNSITVYNHNWKPQASKGIDRQWGSLSIINLILQRYYKGVSPTATADEFEVNILRP